MQAKTPSDIGKIIRNARAAAGLSQTQLAARSDTTQSWISLIENGKDTAELGMVLKVLSVLKLRMDLTDISSPAAKPGVDSPDDFPDIDSIVDGPRAKP